MACQVDYEKLASLAGMTNHNSAANAWRNLKKKLYEDSAPTAGAKATPKKPATPRKRKAAEEKDDKGSDKEEEASPKKKGRGRPAKPKKEPVRKEAVKEEDGADEEEGASEDTTVASTKVEPDDGEMDESV